MGNTIVADTSAAAELRPLARRRSRKQGGQEFNNRRMGRAGDQSFWGIGVPSHLRQHERTARRPAGERSAAVFGGGNRLRPRHGLVVAHPGRHARQDGRGHSGARHRIYLHAVWRLLTDAVLPLDYAEHARYLLTS